MAKKKKGDKTPELDSSTKEQIFTLFESINEEREDTLKRAVKESKEFAKGYRRYSPVYREYFDIMAKYDYSFGGYEDEQVRKALFKRWIDAGLFRPEDPINRYEAYESIERLVRVREADYETMWYAKQYYKALILKTISEIKHAITTTTTLNAILKTLPQEGAEETLNSLLSIVQSSKDISLFPPTDEEVNAMKDEEKDGTFDGVGYIYDAEARIIRVPRKAFYDEIEHNIKEYEFAISSAHSLATALDAFVKELNVAIFVVPETKERIAQFKEPYRPNELFSESAYNILFDHAEKGEFLSKEETAKILNTKFPDSMRLFIQFDESPILDSIFSDKLNAYNYER